MAEGKPLSAGKRYHFHVVYNHEKSPLDATDDNKKSLEYTELTVGLLTTAGMDKSYYHKRDARPGRNIFTELFRVINESEYTLLILTAGFLENCWAKYSSMSAYKKLLDRSKEHRLKILAFNLHDYQIPEEFCQQEILHFTDNLEEDDLVWKKLIQEMSIGEEPVTLKTHNPIKANDDNILRTEKDHLVAHPGGEPSLQSALFDATFAGVSMDGDGLHRTRRMESLHTDGNTTPVREQSEMTKVLQGEKPVTIDLNARSASQPTIVHVMSLEASPKLSVPPVTKAPPAVTKAPPAVTKAPPAVTKAPPAVTKAPPAVTKAPPAVTKAPPAVSKAPPAHVKTTETRDSRGNECMSEKKTINDKTGGQVYAEMPAGKRNNIPSLTNDDDLTLDTGGSTTMRTENNLTADTSGRTVVGTVNEVETNQATDGNTEQTENKEQPLHTQNNVELNAVIHNTNHDHSETFFEDLHLNSLQEETTPNDLSVSGYNTEKGSPEKMQQLKQENLEQEISIEMSSRYESSYSESGIGDSRSTSRASNDMQYEEETAAVTENIEVTNKAINAPDLHLENRREDDSVTEQKRVATNSETDQQLHLTGGRHADNTNLKTVYSDSSERPTPEGQDDVVSSAEVCQTKNSTSDILEEPRDFNWGAFSIYCIGRVVSRTDSLL